jgi:hypothetical protein
LCVSLPPDTLAQGDNVIEIEQSSDPATGMYDELEIDHLAVEWTRAQAGETSATETQTQQEAP